MRASIERLVTALREELKHYGEMLALLERQQELIVARAASDMLQSVSLIQAQGRNIELARAHREDCRSAIAVEQSRPQETTFADLIPLLPAPYQPLVHALVEENNSLLTRVRQRANQNHLMLSRSLELMQNFVNSLLQTRESVTYNDQGSRQMRREMSRPVYEGVG
jgi:hypothetical protein